MSAAIDHVGSVARTELRLRFRRSSTWVLFCILCLSAFALMPDVGSNSVMFLIGKRRVLLNSAATSLTSALLGGFVLSLFGFYLISNAVTRDRRSGVGQLIAPAPVGSAQYLAGKFLANVAFLYTLSGMFMIACMAVHLFRGEAPLEPVVFARTFALMFLPLGPVLAGLALTFECVSGLAGRAGDVLYFFLWMTFMSLPAALAGSGHPSPWLLGFDVTGFGFFLSNIIQATGSTHFTIGYAPYDAALTPVLFPGFDPAPSLVIPRFCSALTALPLFGIALAAFRRFDPARGRPKRNHDGFVSRLIQTFSPGRLQGWIPAVGWLAGPPRLLNAVVLDTHLTLVLTPAAWLGVIAVALTSVVAPPELIRTTVMPLLFLASVPILSSAATRDRASNAAHLVFATPVVRRRYVLVKFLSTLCVILLLSLVPLLRLAAEDPSRGVSLLNGLLFVAASATFFGIATGTPKAFTVLFLLFLYLSVSSKSTAAFDFAGLRDLVTPAIAVIYGAATILMVIAAYALERWKAAREYD
jgi:hypothetical protein